MRHMKIRGIIAAFLTILMGLSVIGCAFEAAVDPGPTKPGQENIGGKLPGGGIEKPGTGSIVSLEPVNTSILTDEDRATCQKTLAKLAFDLAAKTKANAKAADNMLISPTSIVMALTMTANGAKNDTLAQMLSVLGGEGISLDTLNAYLAEYLRCLPNTENVKLALANSIWFRNDPNLQMNPDFLKFNESYFGAAIKPADFDQKTIDAINSWVYKNTAGMIEKLLDEIPADAVVYLINALVFIGTWSTPYEDFDILKHSAFTNENGSTSKVSMMQSEERLYLENPYATGTIKYYKDGYEFIALLPKEGVTIEKLLASLDGDSYYALLESAKSGIVHTRIPEFSLDCTYDMKGIIKELGITQAFDADLADFSQMGEYRNSNLYIDEVKHKTHIEVDRNGTKAAAVTSVGMNYATSVGPSRDLYEVHLDRPFVYIIADRTTHLPIFIGSESTM